MKVLTFLGAAGLGIFAGTWLISWKRQHQGRATVRKAPALNINQASQQELITVLGLDSETAERIVEHRPYPSKIDLLGRMILPEDVYVRIKDRIAYKVS